MTSIHAHHPVVVSTAEPCAAFAAALGVLLKQLDSLLSDITPHQYTASAGDVFMNATVGGHVRHALDHIAALAVLDNPDSTPIRLDYEHRVRGTAIETDTLAARAEAVRLTALIARIATAPPSRAVDVLAAPSRSAAPLTLNSTLARELAFVLSHTIHHCAILRIMLAARGISVPADFGFAPSTLAYQDALQCVR